MRFGRRSRLSDIGVILAILLTVGILAYAGIQIHRASRDLIAGFFKAGPARQALSLPALDGTPGPPPTAKPGSGPVAGATTPTPAPAGTPKPGSPTPQATPSGRVRVGNTNGDGVYLRRTPNLNDRILPWPDNTPLEVVGEDVSADGLVWKKVKDPRGNIGFIPAQYVIAGN